MNHVAIFFVPTGAKQRDFEEALREHFAFVQQDEVPQATTTPVKAIAPTEAPLWTWFVSNPPRPRCF